MGTSCAPIFADLHAAQFERDIPDIVCRNNSPLLYYCRFIDDIFGVAIGTEDQVKEFLNSRTFGTLNVTWNVNKAERGIPFLDGQFFIPEGSNKREIHSRLFRKKLNRHMYIPWSSAHPEVVKKSFIKAELTRLMYLSSKKNYFEESKRTFLLNLRRRGYP